MLSVDHQPQVHTHTQNTHSRHSLNAFMFPFTKKKNNEKNTQINQSNQSKYLNIIVVIRHSNEIF